jgi:general secretion pathway protein E
MSDRAALLDALGEGSDPAGLARAAATAEATGERVETVLTRLGIVSEDRLADALCRLSGRPRRRLADAEPNGDALDALGRAFCRGAGLVPLEGGALAATDPLDDTAIRLAALKLGRPVEVVVATPGEVEAAHERLEAEGRDPEPAEPEAADVERLRDMAADAPVVRLVAAIVRRAAEMRASDIHLEPEDGALRLRYRVDGALREAEGPPAALRAAVISRVKIMARLDIAESRLPQDGRVRTVVAGRELDLRVATTPTLHGEGVVIRLLDRAGLTLTFEGLGFDAPTRAAVERLVAAPHGIVLVTGPTGSGKTTTLYAALRAVDDRTRKIVTVEDPVEYRMAGITQIQVQPAIGLGFAEALRSVLRQDPDTVMIGEIRDLETARIAVQAALTGHLVLATLHTNSAAAAVLRLRDMGVPDYLLAATLEGAVAQRLVRRLCECAEPDPQGAAMAARLGLAEGRWRRPVGCAACAGTGYRGRTALLEVLPASEGLRDLVLSGAGEAALEAEAVSGGMRTLAAHGAERAGRGETSLAEMLRVAPPPNAVRAGPGGAGRSGGLVGEPSHSSAGHRADDDAAPREAGGPPRGAP